MKGCFQVCVPFTLQYEGGFSNDAGDPGGATMLGITWREYYAWRREQGLAIRNVRECTKEEALAIYKAKYWDASGCEGLAAGVDLTVFDCAVNNGVGRAKQFFTHAVAATDGSARALINSVNDQRLAFDKGLSIWRVFGTGWGRRIAGIRSLSIAEIRGEAHKLAKGFPTPAADASEPLRVGMVGRDVGEMQTALRGKGYPVGNVDNIFGQATERAVVLFQAEQGLGKDTKGVWQPSYTAALAKSAGLVAHRAATTEADLRKSGDSVMSVLGLMKAALGWLGLGSATVAASDKSSTLGGMLDNARHIVEPIAGGIAWAGDHRAMLTAVVCAGGFAAVRYLSNRRVAEFKAGDIQGEIRKAA